LSIPRARSRSPGRPPATSVSAQLTRVRARNSGRSEPLLELRGRREALLSLLVALKHRRQYPEVPGLSDSRRSSLWPCWRKRGRAAAALAANQLAPDHVEGGRFAEDEATRRSRVSRIEAKAWKAIEEAADRGVRLQARKMHADADVGPRGEGDLL